MTETTLTSTTVTDTPITNTNSVTEPTASDVSGHLALLLAGAAIAVAVFLIALVAIAASNA